MKPKWFKINDIPYEDMWKDDQIWVPKLLREENFHGYFLFEGHSEILEYNLNEVTNEELKNVQKEKTNYNLGC